MKIPTEAASGLQSSAVICVDGGDLTVETKAEIGSTSVTDKYTYYSGTLYHHVCWDEMLALGEKFVEMKAETLIRSFLALDDVRSTEKRLLFD